MTAFCCASEIQHTIQQQKKKKRKKAFFALQQKKKNSVAGSVFLWLKQFESPVKCSLKRFYGCTDKSLSMLVFELFPLLGHLHFPSLLVVCLFKK